MTCRSTIVSTEEMSGRRVHDGDRCSRFFVREIEYSSGRRLSRSGVFVPADSSSFQGKVDDFSLRQPIEIPVQLI
jgi:hypothetical protein